jgi:hypothetical protein
MIFVAIAMIVNACDSELDRLWRRKLLEEMMHPMGRREN